MKTNYSYTKAKAATQNVAAFSKPAVWADYLALTKPRLSLIVLLSAILSYMIVAGGNVLSHGVSLLILGLGGFCITAAANTLNQVLEQDYDKLMKRTMDRPLAAGRLSTSNAVLFAGIVFTIGVLLLAYFNPLAAVLGVLAVISYAFLYTPLKRVSPISVLVGAIPGALPSMIGCVALQGYVSEMALILFGIQFLWQFPHFWSIGYLGYDDYKKAGFNIVPEQNGAIHPGLGLQSAVYGLLLTVLSLVPFIIGEIALIPCILASTISFIYALAGFNLYYKQNTTAAKKLMFTSFLHLPMVLVIYYISLIF